MTSVADLDTPAVIIDLDIVEANIGRHQKRLSELGIANRPHIKTHRFRLWRRCRSLQARSA